MDKDKEKNLSIKGRTFADFTYDLLNDPPTKSVYRVYFLSFVIWNKASLYFLFFESTRSVEFKLSSLWLYTPFIDYVPFWFSFYIGPLVLLFLFYTLFSSIYLLGSGIHFNVLQREEKLKEDLLEKQLKNIDTIETILNKNEDLEKQWEQDVDGYEKDFKNNISYFNGKIHSFKNLLQHALSVKKFHNGYVDYSRNEVMVKAISFLETRGLVTSDSNNYFSFTDKGNFLIKKFNVLPARSALLESPQNPAR